MRWTTSLLCTATFVSLAASARAQAVRILEQPALGTFTTLQSAVAAASNGDVLIVAPGAYTSVTIDNKSLWVEALQPGTVTINGTVEVKNLGGGRRVVLVGLNATGATVVGQSQPALRATNDLGQLRIDRCTFTGGAGSSAGCLPYGSAGHGAELTNCSRVLFVRSTLRGGKGGGVGYGDYTCHGGVAGDGVRAQGSTVALYDSTCVGGVGGQAGELGGHGGDGYHAVDFGVFASNASFEGGDGGLAWDFLYAIGGDGGHGLELDSGAQGQLLDCVFLGGEGGRSLVDYAYYGAPGDPTHGSGIFNYHSGSARVFDAATIASDGTSLAVTVLGVPGDRAYLVTCSQPAYTILHPTVGLILIADAPKMRRTLLGTVPGSGTLNALVPLGNLVGPQLGQLTYAQGIVADASGARVWGSPLHLLTLDRAGAIDCNGNGALDYLDLVEGTASDCEHDLQLDSCEIASGSSPDCNSNGVPDACDLAAGTSADLDHDNVPDECQVIPGGPDWYVDDSAAPGGNGSINAPFRTIWEAVLTAQSGHRIRIADGLYTGSSNRGVDFNGKSLVVEGINGPANCIVDCEQLDRAFYLHSNEGPSRIEGLTIRNGLATRGGGIDVGSFAVPEVFTLRDCVIENCHASGNGGGAHLNGTITVEDCVFQSNGISGQSAGGGLDLDVHGTSSILRCVFDSNTSPYTAAGLTVQGSGTTVTISHCVFTRNVSGTNAGGAVHSQFSAGFGLPNNPAVFVDCIFAGNRAGGGGGALYANGPIDLFDCTIVDNDGGAGRGGAVAVYRPTRIRNCVIWGNTAATGSQLSTNNNSVASLLVERSDVSGGQAGVAVFAGSAFTWGAGNLAVLPQFADADGPDNNVATVIDNDYRLGATSPCIDAGDNALVAADVLDVDGDGNTSEPCPLDLDLLPRFVEVPSAPNTGAGTPPLVDLGCYERP